MSNKVLSWFLINGNNTDKRKIHTFLVDLRVIAIHIPGDVIFEALSQTW